MASSLSRPIRQRAARDVAVQVVARVVNLALGVLVTAMIVRSLGKDGFGQWATLAAVLAIVGYLKRLGLDSLTIREAAADPEHEHEWISTLLVVQALLALPVALLSALAVVLVSDSDEMLIAGLVMLLTVPTGVASAVGTVFTVRMRNGVLMAVLTLNSVIWGVTVFALFLADAGLVAFALAFVVTTTLTNILTTVLALRLVSLRMPTRERMRTMLRVGTPLAIGSALTLAYASIDQFLVFTIAGSDQAGLYGSVTRVLQSWAFLPGSLLVTLSPLLAASWPHDRARLFRACRMAIEYLTIASLGLLAFVLTTADPVVRVLFGDDFAPAAPGLKVLAGAFVVISYGYLTDNLMLVLKLQKKLLYIALAGLAVNVPANLILIPSHGFMGAAWATLGTELFVESIAVFILWRAFEIRRVQVGRLVRIAIAAALLGACLQALESMDVPLGVLCLVAATLYPALLILLRAVRIEDITAMALRREPAL